MASITLSDVTVEFPVHNTSSRSLQLHVFGALGGKLAEHNKAVVVRALKRVNLALRDGDRVGIVGPNGAGKTTLLRVLAGVYDPSEGAIKVDGRLSSFADLTLGMDPEATGLQNIISGYQCGTVYKPIYLEAQAAVALAMYLRAGITPPSTLVNSTVADIDEHNAKVPSILLTPEWVTAQTVQSTVVQDGFVPASQICAGSFAADCTKYGIS